MTRPPDTHECHLDLEIEHLTICQLKKKSLLGLYIPQIIHGELNISLIYTVERGLWMHE
jgi:hypothetical protein